ncbi:DUF2938 domain-containing protein [Burkholderia sp. FERM BP-3421]|uniref:DUF2938 domain-containing protein n=1 Tax=Burkholderia sp. FERM BP-3421 TaxID=1494466 RepID=UPI002361FDD4|nr:DUF2938 domain-containing protein [Burkholderia sp. FERM BP-3421]WDD94291.1 DUF2938 domain-containing protein [Burkholderia sp. FERM BP-3421]
MTPLLEILLHATLIGIGATAVLDLWGALLKRALGIAPLNLRMVGRWIGHVAQGRFFLGNVAAAASIRGEALIGWAIHYLSGIVFALALVAVSGMDWLRAPTLVPALSVGIGTIVLPFFVMQPGMGAGIAASNTPKPNQARLRSLLSHTVFGVGLYGAAGLLALLRTA